MLSIVLIVNCLVVFSIFSLQTLNCIILVKYPVSRYEVKTNFKYMNGIIFI